VSTRGSSKTVIYTALIGNLLVAATKFYAAAWTGSSAMLSEGVHSCVDTINEGLLLYGLSRASQPPDDLHPLGYGREVYFWSFVVSLLLLTGGAGVSLYQGVTHVFHGPELVDPFVNYIVLALSFVFEFVSWWVALKAFHARKGSLGYVAAVIHSKDPPSFLILFEDTASLIGLLVAFAGTSAAAYFGMPALDGLASIGIALVLAVMALVVARESKELLIGEPAHSATSESIQKLAREVPGVEGVNGLSTVHLAPNQIVATLSLEFDDDLTTPDIEAAVVRLENNIKAVHPEVVAIFVKPQTASVYGKTKARSAAAP
jgi:cation diffusion facilitator family transporter